MRSTRKHGTGRTALISGCGNTPFKGTVGSEAAKEKSGGVVDPMGMEVDQEIPVEL